MDGFRQTLSGLVSFFIKTVGEKDEEAGVIKLNACRVALGVALFVASPYITFVVFALISYLAAIFNINVVSALIPFDISFFLPASDLIFEIAALKDSGEFHKFLFLICSEAVLVIQPMLSLFIALMPCIVLYRINKAIGKVYIPISEEIYEAYYKRFSCDPLEYAKELKKRQELHEGFSFFKRFYYSFFLDALSFDKTLERGVGISLMSGLFGLVVFLFALAVFISLAFISMLFATGINKLIIDEALGFSFLDPIFVGEGILINKLVENGTLFAVQPLITFGAVGVIYFSLKWICAKLGSVSFSIDPDR